MTEKEDGSTQSVELQPEGKDVSVQPEEVDVSSQPEEKDVPVTDVSDGGADSDHQDSLAVSKGEKPMEEVAIPNPMREVDYSFSLAEYLGDDKVVSVLASDEVGDLTVDELSKSLSGKPVESREFWLEVETTDKVYRFNCFVNENPRLLWKDIPSDQIVKSDKDYRAMQWPDMEMAAVSHRGRSHAHRGGYRDDDFFLTRIGSFTLSVVADGAGSAPLSSTGSKVFCEWAGLHLADLIQQKYDALRDLLNRVGQTTEDTSRNPELLSFLYEILPAAALYGRNKLMELASDNKVPLKHYHTTSLISLTTQVNPECYFCAAFQVGDGITAALAGQHLELLSQADEGNFPGETVFVTSSGVFDDANGLLKRIRYCFTPVKPVVFSMTDGITDSYFADNPRLDDLSLWQQLLTEVSDGEGHLKPAYEICGWLNYYVDSSHDDRTMSIVAYK